MFSVAKPKPHAVCIPVPFQSHINAMLKFAKILHFKGFHITFVNTEFNHERVLLTRGPDSLNGLPDFHFETIPDGLPPPSDINATQDMLALAESFTTNGPTTVRNLITMLNKQSTSSADPPVSCIVTDSMMACTLEAAEELGIPQVVLWPMNASAYTPSVPETTFWDRGERQLRSSFWDGGSIGYLLGHQIVEQGLLQLQDKSYLTNGYLDTPVDFIPGLRDFRLRDLPSSIWDGNEDLQNLVNRALHKAPKASAVILNTFDSLEIEALETLTASLPAVYTIGPLHFLEQQIPSKQISSFGLNLLQEQQNCLKWLNSQKPNSVIYVNFGSTTVMSQKQLLEFAWGLANCKHPFLWVIRPDLVIGEAADLPIDFKEETAERSMISGWCPQEKVLSHSSIGGFLTHCGWNSVMDAMCSGVPIICWPFMGDQYPNCRLACTHWGIGMEIEKDVKREDVEGIVREAMEGEKGKEIKKRTMEWKRKAEESTKHGGSSYMNLDKIVKEVLLRNK